MSGAARASDDGTDCRGGPSASETTYQARPKALWLAWVVYDPLSGPLPIPIVGHVVVLGYLAAVAISAVEGAVAVGGLSAIGAALASIGIPKDSVMSYETAIKADEFVVMVHGPQADVERARELLVTLHPHQLDMHPLTAPHGAERLPVTA